MKKIISTILCISLLSSIICIPVSAISKGTESSNISGFINGINELTKKYDADKDFEVTPENISSENFSEEAPTYYSASSVSENETDDVPELDFQTCRLIVQSDVDFNNYGAVEVVSGFENFHILQYETESDTKTAYENLLKDSAVISVDIDAVISVDSIETTRTDTEKEIYSKEDFYNCWSLNATGMDKVLEYYSNQQFPEIVVGVIDSGVNYEHELFEGRLIRTFFNSSGEDDPNDESDKNGHGTAVTSCIIKTTPDNVKIATYRVLNAKGTGTTSNGCAGILQAIEDGIRILNLSLGFAGDLEIQCSILNYAKANNTFIVCGAGNASANTDIRDASYINTSDDTCSVGASTKQNLPAYFTNYGSSVDIVAPGLDVVSADIDGSYSLFEGTSAASPYMAGVFTTLTCVYPELSSVEKMRMIKASSTELSEPYIKYCFETGVIDCLALFNFEKLKPVEISLDAGIYEGPVTVELFAEEGYEIYYTMDQTYPSPTNGTLYTKPISFVGDAFEIVAVAYKDGVRSDFSRELIHAAQIGTDDMFTITDDGTITSYTGDTFYLKVPETVNGITVTDIAEGVFAESSLWGLILPDTMTFLGDMTLWGGTSHNSCVYGNKTISVISGKNIKILGTKAFYECTSLREVDFPNCEQIGNEVFYFTNLVGAQFPKVTTLLTGAFYYAQFLRELYLPNCTKMLDDAFSMCKQLQHLYAPLIDIDVDSIEYPDWEFDLAEEGFLNTFDTTVQLTYINLEQARVIGWGKHQFGGAFYRSNIHRMDLSKVEYIYEIPWPQYNYLSKIYHPVTVELNLPATLRRCVDAKGYFDDEIRNYVVYASLKTYAEKWANDNGVKFIALNAETSIAEDIEPVWDKYSYKPLYFDARGFNRTYQWYGSYDNKIGNDVAINDATTNEFNPRESSKYAYYYCQMTSTDIDNEGNVVSSFTVNSRLCQNRFYYMYAKDKTEIDVENNLIFTKQFVCRDFLEIVHVNEHINYLLTPSYEYQNNCWYGTGSQLQIQDADASTETTYTLIVEGDINGDSAVDVLDASAVEKATNSHKELTGNYFLAGDSNRDGVIDIVDYQSVVNRAM
ncbi:MAG: S8 family serine peptidase [Clostridia bacterium]|nr:S8 family serine peptidase [Clostridia bacterium]